jgi:tRNA pseudouridine38-40 synthase
VLSVSIRRAGDDVIIEITGDGFLKYMVRNIVGTLVDVGKGKLSPAAFREILRSCDRKKAGVAAPAFGLYLVEVRY